LSCKVLAIRRQWGEFIIGVVVEEGGYEAPIRVLRIGV
jgi:hypothetical protein